MINKTPFELIKHVISNETLQSQTGMTIAERCNDIKSKTGSKISTHKLTELYSAFGIKQKKVKPMPKYFTPHLEQKRIYERRMLHRGLKKCEREDLDIYYLDETVFVMRQQHKSWSLPKSYCKSYHYNKF